MKKILKHKYECDNCKKPAVYNLQNYWHLYDINSGGNFKELKNWEEDVNEFWCEGCYEEEFKS